jgi:hypothetical protein
MIFCREATTCLATQGENIPISISIDTGSKHDVSIIKEQLTDLHNSPRSGRIRP